jgi:hypothetical protein
MKPCSRWRERFLGWYVLFMGACRSSFSGCDPGLKHTNGWRSASLRARPVARLASDRRFYGAFGRPVKRRTGPIAFHRDELIACPNRPLL